MQEFLVSYAVKLDEAGLQRLQNALNQNRSQAAQLTAAFTGATSALAALQAQFSRSGSLSGFIREQQQAAATANQTQKAISALALSYQTLNQSPPGSSNGSFSFALPSATPFSTEGSTQQTETTDLLFDIRSSLIHLTMPSALPSATGGASATGFTSSAAFTASTAVSAAFAPATALPDTEELSVAWSAFIEALPQPQLAPSSEELSSSLATLQAQLTDEAPEISLHLNLKDAQTKLKAYRKSLAAEPLALTASTGSILSAASSALDSVRNLFASSKLPITVTFQSDNSDDGTSGNSGLSFTDDTGNTSGLLKLGTGGRFTSPTLAEIAEDGSTEYVIPVSNTASALPLLSQLLSELSDSARQTLLSPYVQTIASAQINAHSSDAANGLTSLFSASANSLASLGALASAFTDLSSATKLSQAAATISTVNHNSVQAPITINVTAEGTAAADIGDFVYDLTEQSLLKTLNGVL